jgi:hypothetical protein
MKKKRTKTADEKDIRMKKWAVNGRRKILPKQFFQI